jgi:hypothetical protein
VTAPDEAVIGEAAREVEVLGSFPRLATLVDETAAQTPKAGGLGLASRVEAAGIAWYLLAGDDASYTDADSLARSFVWPSYARGRRAAADLKPGDAFADAVIRRSPGGVIAMLAPPARSEECARAIDLLFEIRSRRPVGAVVAPRPIGRVLRDFDDAVAREDVAEAQRSLAEAWATGRLSLVNRSYLQARVLGAQRDWKGLLDHAVRLRFPDLDLPRAVEQDLLQAIYWMYLRGRLDVDDIEGAVTVFREQVQPTLGSIFRDHRGLPNPQMRQAWMTRLAALDREWPPAIRDELLAQAGDDERQRLDHIATFARFTEPVSPEESATELLTAREDAAAFSLAEAGSELPKGARAGILVQAALRLDDPTRLGSAAAAIDEVGDEEAVLAPTALVERVADYSRPTIVVEGWSTWLRALFEQPDWPDAVRMVKEHGEEWGQAMAEGTDSLDDAVDVIEALAGEEALRAVLPRLVRAAIPDGARRSEAVRLRRRLLQALAYAISQDPASGVADLDALADILAALLEAGVSPEDFEQIVAEIEDVWQRMGGPTRLARWVVDVLLLVTTYPCPSEARRAQMIGALLAPLCADASRGSPHVRVEVWLEINDLLEGSGLTELVPPAVLADATAVDADDAEEFTHLEGRRILLHTLVPGAAERAGAFVAGVAPSCRVVTDDSHAGSSQLRDQVRGADMIVIAARAAKHAATDFIRQEASAPIVWASGKGWSSLVEALRVGASQV